MHVRGVSYPRNTDIFQSMRQRFLPSPHPLGPDAAGKGHHSAKDIRKPESQDRIQFYSILALAPRPGLSQLTEQCGAPTRNGPPRNSPEEDRDRDQRTPEVRGSPMSISMSNASGTT